ncbi:cyanoexosortase A system-associated protein [Nostocales cyanobacterium HT-58-2]|nr:cyanoexosortase A system-associated protein [Nostocales cyanobacterium HT-58-2]
MIIWKRFRVMLLALTFCSILFVLANVMLLPTKDKGTPFVFPEYIPLPQWRLSVSHPLPKPTKKQTEILLSQKHYRYLKEGLLLDIEMRYLTDGDVVKFLQDFNFISSSAVIRQREGVGYYGLGVDKQRAYLSACINPQSGSTFTVEQFHKKKDLYTINPQHLLSWLLNNKKLQDKRCLWAHLSIPLKDSSPEAAYQVLENAWFSWYKWWQLRFPKP